MSSKGTTSRFYFDAPQNKTCLLSLGTPVKYDFIKYKTEKLCPFGVPSGIRREGLFPHRVITCLHKIHKIPFHNRIWLATGESLESIQWCLLEDRKTAFYSCGAYADQAGSSPVLIVTKVRYCLLLKMYCCFYTPSLENHKSINKTTTITLKHISIHLPNEHLFNWYLFICKTHHHMVIYRKGLNWNGPCIWLCKTFIII